MEYNSTPLPTGKKFFPFGTDKEELLVALFAPLLKKENIEIIQKALKTMDEFKASHEYWNMRSPMRNWEVLTDDEYPVINMRARDLVTMYPGFNMVNGSKKYQYASRSRIQALDIPVIGRDIKVQYDPLRKGLIVHDCVYEGELVGNKPMVVNKQLKSLIREKVGEIKLLVLLGDESCIGMDDHARYQSKAAKGEVIADLAPKLFDGTYDDQTLAMICSAMDMYVVEYNQVQYNTKSRKRPDIDFNYYLDTSKPLNDDGKDFQFPANVRTKFIYHFGGYVLPDNYEEWFDG